METTQDMAVSLLRKWQEDGRVVQAAVSFGRTRCTVLGRIERINGDEIWIDGSSEDEHGEKYGLILRFADVSRISFEDARFFSQHGRDVQEQVDEAFESFLSIDLGPCKCSIFACRLPDEIPK
jgi:hypothetical protein